MYTKKKEKRFNMKERDYMFIWSCFFYSFLEMLRNVQIYQENDDSFDAIIIDPQRDQIIIGAK